jgi:hypothetical protein
MSPALGHPSSRTVEWVNPATPSATPASAPFIHPDWWLLVSMPHTIAEGNDNQGCHRLRLLAPASAAVGMRGMVTTFHLEFGLVETVVALILTVAVAALLLKPKRDR